MRSTLGLALVVVLALLVASPVAAAHTVTVSSGDMGGWQFQTSDGGTPPTTASATFVAGPGTPPLGTGSVQLAVGANGSGAAEIRTSEFAATALADVTGLSYWTYIVTPGSGGQAPYLIATVDLNGDSSSDDLLFFEPLYQDGSYSGEPVPDQGSVTVGTWQDWDAEAGGWWSLNAGTFGPPLVTLDSYAAANPGAALLTLRIVAGFGAGAWDNFVGNVDAAVIGTTAHTTTYDFEVAAAATPTPTPTPVPTPTPEPDADATATPAPMGDTETPTPGPEAGLLPDTATADGTAGRGLLGLVAASALATLSASAIVWRSRSFRRRESD